MEIGLTGSNRFLKLNRNKERVKNHWQLATDTLATFLPAPRVFSFFFWKWKDTNSLNIHQFKKAIEKHNFQLTLIFLMISSSFFQTNTLKGKIKLFLTTFIVVSQMSQSHCKHPQSSSIISTFSPFMFSPFLSPEAPHNVIYDSCSWQ